MNLFDNEKIIYQSKNKRITLTNLRLLKKSRLLFRKTQKSIFVDQITGSDVHAKMEPKFLKWSLVQFITLNGIIFIYNNYLLKSIVVQFLFGSEKIPSNVAMFIFYLSLIIGSILLWFFFVSIKRVATIYAPGISMDIQLGLIDSDFREILIEKIEEVKIVKM